MLAKYGLRFFCIESAPDHIFWVDIFLWGLLGEQISPEFNSARVSLDYFRISKVARYAFAVPFVILAVGIV